MEKSILIIGTLDTKGVEFGYVRDLIQARGHRTLVMDTGVAGEPLFKPEIAAAQVAEAGGSTLAALRQAGDRGAALEVMGRGARALALRCLADALGTTGSLAIGAVLLALVLGWAAKRIVQRPKRTVWLPATA